MAPTAPEPQLPPEVQADIAAHCRDVFPNQACGLVLFDEAGTARAVERVANRGAWPYGFQIPAEAQFAAFRKARTQGWRINGVYHCHTVSEALPTGRDLKRPVPAGFLYIIVSLLQPTRPVLRSFVFDDGVPREVAQAAAAL